MLPFANILRTSRILGGRWSVHVAIDDSDTLGSSDFVSLSALAASDQTWADFADAWRSALVKHQLQFLHTSDFMNKRGSHKFDSPKDYSERVSILEEFSLLIKDRIDYGYAFAMHKPSYDSLVRDKRKRVNSQTFCFYRLISKFVDQANEGIINEPLSFLIDESAKQSQHFLSLWQDLRRRDGHLQSLFVGISFCDDRYLVPVQAADLMANCVVKEIRRGEDAFSSDSPFRSFNPIDKPSVLQMESEWWKEEDVLDNKQYIIESCSS